MAQSTPAGAANSETPSTLGFCPSTEAEQRAALAWLRDYHHFWQTRWCFYKMAFGLGEGAVNPAARPIPEAEGFLSLTPLVARQLWGQAMREAGGTLTRQQVAEMAALGSTGRLAMVAASVDALGLTPAARELYAGAVGFEDDSLWPSGFGGLGFWQWVARECVAVP